MGQIKACIVIKDRNKYSNIKYQVKGEATRIDIYL